MVSGGQQRNSAMHTHVSILPPTPLSPGLPLSIEQSSVCCTVGPCWLPILNIAVCTCPSQTPSLSLPPYISPGDHKFTLKVRTLLKLCLSALPVCPKPWRGPVSFWLSRLPCDLLVGGEWSPAERVSDAT